MKLQSLMGRRGWVISAALLISLSGCWAANAEIIAEGQSKTFEYTSGFNPASDPVQVMSFTTEFTSTDTLSVGESFSLAVLNSSDAVLASTTYVNEDRGELEGCNCTDISNPVELANLTQSFKVRYTSLVGSVDLADLGVDMHGTTNTYAAIGVGATPNLPDPPAGALLVQGAGDADGGDSFVAANLALASVPTPTNGILYVNIKATFDTVYFPNADFRINVYDLTGNYLGDYRYSVSSNTPGNNIVSYTFEVDTTERPVNTAGLHFRIGPTTNGLSAYLTNVEASVGQNTALQQTSVFYYDETVQEQYISTSPYIPDDRPGGTYAQAWCEDISDANAVKVTLQDNQKLADALSQLDALSLGAGGIIEVPYDTETVLCDVLNPKKNPVSKLTIRGIQGPNGQRPRFYCQSYKPKAGQFEGAIMSGTPSVGFTLGFSPEILVENVEIAGYNKQIALGDSGTYIVRNSWLHHGAKDGIGGNGIDEDNLAATGSTLELCGNEISHSGQNNASHCMYHHRGRGIGSGAEFTLKMTDNYIHSCNGSSGIKSIAENNLIYNNEIYKTAAPGRDNPYSRKACSQMLVDIPACSLTTVEDNTFGIDRFDSSCDGNATIGVRMRRGIYGCDSPPGWHDYCKSDPTQPGCVYAGSQFYNASYWTGLSGAKSFPFYVTNNTFNISGYKDTETTIVRNNGTAPGWAKTLGGNTICFVRGVDYPTEWYERSMVYMSGNTYNIPYRAENVQDEPQCLSQIPAGVPTITLSNEQYSDQTINP